MGKYDQYTVCKRGQSADTGYKKIPADRIISWIEKNFEYKLRKGGVEYQICDPFDGDTKFRFQINPEQGICHSWHGDLWAGPVNPKTGRRNCSFIKFVRIYRKCSYKEALEEVLGDSRHVSLYMRPGNRPGVQDVKRTVSVRLPGGTRLLSEANDTQARLLKAWLKSRGYTDEGIEKHELYYLSMNVYWPYFEWDELVYWQSRSRVNKRFEFPDTYVYDEQGNITGKTEGGRADYLYGFDDVEPANYIIITESIFDMNTLGVQALASGGALLSPNQVKKLKILGPKRGIILSPDNDKAGIKSIIDNAAVLRKLNVPIGFSIPPTTEYQKDGETKQIKDWNEMLTELHMTQQEIRAAHDGRVQPLNAESAVRLRKMLHSRIY